MPDCRLTFFQPSCCMTSLSSPPVILAHHHLPSSISADENYCVLNITEGDSSQNHNRDPDKMAEARVDIKKLATFLHGQQVSPSKVICSESDVLILLL